MLNSSTPSAGRGRSRRQGGDGAHLRSSTTRSLVHIARAIATALAREHGIDLRPPSPRTASRRTMSADPDTRLTGRVTVVPGDARGGRERAP